MAETKKLAGKYDTPEAMEKAYLELEAKLGAQGTELGEVKKLVAQYQPWVEQAIPVVKWYADNQRKVEAWVSNGMRTETAAQPNAAVATATDAARGAAANTAGYEWLTPQEKAGLIGEIRDGILHQTLQPWTQEFSKQVQAFASDAEKRLQNQHRSFADVMWKTLERMTPKDKLDEARAWHNASMRFADPNKINPLDLGDEFVSMTAENASLKSKLAEYEKKREETSKAAIPSLFGSPSPDTVAPNDVAAPEDRDARMRAVLNDVQTQHGPEGVRSMFPSLV